MLDLMKADSSVCLVITLGSPGPPSQQKPSGSKHLPNSSAKASISLSALFIEGYRYDLFHFLSSVYIYIYIYKVLNVYIFFLSLKRTDFDIWGRLENVTHVSIQPEQVGTLNGITWLENSWWFLTKLSTRLPRIPAILLLCIFPAGGASDEEDLSLITPEILRSPYHPTGAMSHTPLLTKQKQDDFDPALIQPGGERTFSPPSRGPPPSSEGQTCQGRGTPLSVNIFHGEKEDHHQTNPALKVTSSQVVNCKLSSL